MAGVEAEPFGPFDDHRSVNILAWSLPVYSGGADRSGY
jgi:hypothetical protein